MSNIEWNDSGSNISQWTLEEWTESLTKGETPAGAKVRIEFRENGERIHGEFTSRISDFKQRFTHAGDSIERIESEIRDDKDDTGWHGEDITSHGDTIVFMYSAGPRLEFIDDTTYYKTQPPKEESRQHTAGFTCVYVFGKELKKKIEKGLKKQKDSRIGVGTEEITPRKTSDAIHEKVDILLGIRGFTEEEAKRIAKIEIAPVVLKLATSWIEASQLSVEDILNIGNLKISSEHILRKRYNVELPRSLTKKDTEKFFRALVAIARILKQRQSE